MNLSRGQEKKTTHDRNSLNKVGYTATPVACGWAGAVFEVTWSLGQEQWGQRPQKPQKSKVWRTDGRTDRPTKRVVESRSTQLEIPLMRLFLGYHSSPWSFRSLYIMIKIYLGQNDWISQTRANSALTGTGCCWFFVKTNWFSQKTVEIKQWNLKHRNYLILSIQWFQAHSWVFCRLGVKNLQK